MSSSFRYKIGVSFTGEHREYVKRTCEELLGLGFSKDEVFYDGWHQARLTGINADVRLTRVYGEECQAVVVFLSKNYKDKPWTGNIEWRAIRDLINNAKAECICLLRIDDVDINTIEGLSATRDIATSVSDLNPVGTAEFIVDWYGEHIGGSALVNGKSHQLLQEDKSRELSLGIGCDGKKLVLTDEALDALSDIESELIEDSSAQLRIENVTFKYEVQPVDLYHMLGGEDYEENSELPHEVVGECEQWLAGRRTYFEDQARQAITFALNDPAFEFLLGRSAGFVSKQYRLSPAWKNRHHTNKYGFVSQFNRAFLWEKVMERALLYMEGRDYQLWNNTHATSIDCAYYNARDEWHFSSVIGCGGKELLDDNTMRLLSWPMPYPLDMFDVPIIDLVESVYPDLCWEVGRLLSTNPNEYNRLFEKYEGNCFDWRQMRIGLH